MHPRNPPKQSENGMMTLEEVKAIYGPLLEKANTVQATYMWPGTLMLVSLPKGTVVQYGDTTFSLPYDYYLADDPRFGLDRCHSLADLRDLTEVAYTPECAERAYYNRYLVGSDPKFIEYEGELYALDCEGTEYVEFELDTLRIREQKENTIVAEIICWEGDSEEPSTGIVPIKMTANGWRLDRAVFEVTSN